MSTQGLTAITLTTTEDTLQAIERALDGDPRIRSVNTRRGYLHDLAAFEDWRQGRPLTKLLVEQYAAELHGAGRATSGINRALASIRWWARRMGDMAFEDTRLERGLRDEIVTQAGRVAGIRDVKGDRKQKGRHIANGELAALLDACANDPTPAGVRDAALIALAWVTGMRREELASLTLSSLTRRGGQTDGGDFEVSIYGKGGKTRTGYVDNGAADALADWLTIREPAPSLDSEGGGPLFYAIRKGGHVQVGEGMSDEALAQMLARRAEQAGVKKLTWHDFRRTFAGNLLDAGVDLATVQRLMGHVSPTTTSNYDRRGEEVKRQAIKNLHVPYRRRRMA